MAKYIDITVRIKMAIEDESPNGVSHTLDPLTKILEEHTTHFVWGGYYFDDSPIIPN